jgi:hypothetical protein
VFWPHRNKTFSILNLHCASWCGEVWTTSRCLITINCLLAVGSLQTFMVVCLLDFTWGFWSSGMLRCAEWLISMSLRSRIDMFWYCTCWWCFTSCYSLPSSFFAEKWISLVIRGLILELFEVGHTTTTSQVQLKKFSFFYIPPMFWVLQTSLLRETDFF